MMSRALLFTILCAAAALPSVSGTAILSPRLSSAGCTGHFKDLSVTSITCDYSNDGCTYGSEVFVTGQVTVDADLPRPMKVSVARTVPGFPMVGQRIYSTEVNDICESGSIITYPDGDDNVATCPGAGLYNFNFVYENFGTRQSWFAGWSGYTFGMALHIKHEGGGSDFGTCFINVHAATGSDDSYATNATFVSIATLGLAGICVSMFAKRRKERLSSTDPESEERTKELATNFELVQDSAVV